MASPDEETLKPPRTAVSNLERIVRTHGLDIEKSEVARLRSFIYQKVYDLMIAASASAAANNRQLYEPHDMPITRGLRHLMDEFQLSKARINLGPFFTKMATLPPPDRGASPAAENLLPALIGALTVGLARSFKIIDPNMTKPTETDWQKVEQIFDLLL